MADRGDTYRVRGPFVELTRRPRPRIDPRARGGLLGVRLPDRAGRHPRLAFRSRPPDALPVGIAAGPHAEARLAALSRRPESAAQHSSRSRCARGARARAAIVLLVRRRPAVLLATIRRSRRARTARLAVDAALQRAAGRADAFAARHHGESEPAPATSISWCPDCSA